MDRYIPFSDGVPGGLKLLARSAVFSTRLSEAVDMVAAVRFVRCVDVFSRKAVGQHYRQ